MVRVPHTHTPEQQSLFDDPDTGQPTWQPDDRHPQPLDDRTRAIGKWGLAKARAALTEAIENFNRALDDGTKARSHRPRTLPTDRNAAA